MLHHPDGDALWTKLAEPGVMESHLMIDTAGSITPSQTSMHLGSWWIELSHMGGTNNGSDAIVARSVIS